MKKKIVLSLMLGLVALGLLFSNTAYAVELPKSELSKKYQEWLQLPEKERKNTIPPLPFNVRGKKVSGIVDDIE